MANNKRFNSLIESNSRAQGLKSLVDFLVCEICSVSVALILDCIFFFGYFNTPVVPVVFIGLLIVLIVVSLAFSMVDNIELFNWDGTMNLQPLLMPLGIVMLSATVAVFGSVWLVKKLYATRTFDHIALRQELKAEDGFTGVQSGMKHLVGEPVVVFTDMRPSGKVKTTEGKIIEASLKFGGYAMKGETLKVISVEQGRLYCEKL
jgi:hypothetical protein